MSDGTIPYFHNFLIKQFNFGAKERYNGGKRKEGRKEGGKKGENINTYLSGRPLFTLFITLIYMFYVMLPMVIIIKEDIISFECIETRYNSTFTPHVS